MSGDKAEDPGAERMPDNGKPRIVLVEDNDKLRVAMELFLNLEGYTTLTAGSVAAVRELQHSLRATDILIADYHLDGSNTGLELVESLRKYLRTDLPVIILSGDLPLVRRMLESPLPKSRLLSKPVDVPALIQAIDELSRAS